MRSNPCIIGGKIPFDPNSISGTSERGVSVRRGEKRWKDLRVYIHVISAFFVFLLLCLSAFFGAVKKSIEQNVRQTITTNIDRQSAAFSSDITIQYQYLEGFAGYLGEIGELCSENVMTLMR